jgi:SAM-dependent methyltransferase
LAIIQPQLHHGFVASTLPPWQTLTDAQAARWAEMLDGLAGAVPSGAPSVVVDGDDGLAAGVAERLAASLRERGRPCARLTGTAPSGAGDRTDPAVVVADGPRWRAHPPTGRWDVVIWLRTPDGDNREQDADIVVDLHDPDWPVIRRLADRLGGPGRWYLTEARAFFATRAATWDTRFGDDLPAYAAAVAEAGLPPGGAVVDVGCGTGRAFPALRGAVGDGGTVIGIDLTPQMLAEAHRRGRDRFASLVLADARRLPLADAGVDAVFAAGLVTHLPDAGTGLRELARVTRPGGRLVLFHPSGRAALAARHRRPLRPDEPLSEAELRRSTAHAGWRLIRYDDAPHRFLALADRVRDDSGTT